MVAGSSPRLNSRISELELLSVLSWRATLSSSAKKSWKRLALLLLLPSILQGNQTIRQVNSSRVPGNLGRVAMRDYTELFSVSNTYHHGQQKNLPPLKPSLVVLGRFQRSRPGTAHDESVKCAHHCPRFKDLRHACALPACRRVRGSCSI